MRCDGFKRDLYVRADGELRGDAVGRLDAHLAGCESCRTTECQIAEFWASVYRAPAEVELPEGVSARIFQTVRSRSHAASPLGIQIATPAPVEVLAAVVAALLIGAAAGVFLRPQTEFRPASLSEWRGLPVSAFGGTYSQLMGKAVLR